MAVNYTRQEVEDKCKDALTKIGVFYQKGFVNHKGITSDTEEYYTEIVAEYVLNHISEFRNAIKRITREKSYKTQSHKGEYSSSSNRIEEIIAMSMFNYCKDGSSYNYIGRVIDYQTPLKSSQSDKAGKIDLLAYDGHKLSILELKRPDSEESMLRCVLEGYTYFKTVDVEKLLSDFSLPADTVVQISPLVFLGGAQWKEMKENRPSLEKLINELNIIPYYISREKDAYIIQEESNG